ncbi:MAG TPA: phosphatidylglycerol lysyltransferase domain-containing protein [Smithellaceae bacterium]|nr:phosphatidylglycerol lysyltransferase domain-containing protein [Smithellaceae bacterium]HRS82619.1 phosphatidylglycerol lysyltransferase domain-containing protein [Smithellaceae bacterium]
MDITETIELAHRSFLTEQFHQMHLNISDYTFANVYLFRKLSCYEILKKECGVFISAHNRQGQNYVMPLADLRVCDLAMLRGLLNGRNFIFPVPEEWLPFFPENEFSATFDESESDYIYRTAHLASFSGKTYSRHRNHLNQFLGTYRPAAEPLGPDNLQDALTVLRRWQDESRSAQGKTDFSVCEEALQQFSSLALWGTLYSIENRPAGFVIGEALNRDTFCLHFAKGLKTYHGIYEFMFNDSAVRLQPRYTYLNLEEDLGNRNLRKTKMSYGPERILKKYRVSLKEVVQ